MTYEVLVDDNFHYQDTDYRYRAGEFGTAEEAIAHCRQMVDAYLDSALATSPEMTAAELLASYEMFGDDPWVCSPRGEPRVEFSAWTYAEEQCRIRRGVADGGLGPQGAPVARGVRGPPGGAKAGR